MPPNGPMPLPPNPLLPMVNEMAARLEKLERRTTGKLWARSSTEGPQSINELRVLLGRNGMWAAAWLLEGVPDLIESAVEQRTEDIEKELEEAEAEVASLEGKLQYIHKLTLTEGTEDNGTK